MPCPPGQTIYHAMPARPFHILCKAPCIDCQATTIYHAMPARLCNIPCYASPDHTLYHIMPTRSYHMPCHAHQAIPYTMPCPPGYIIHHRQAIPFPMPCPPGHTVYHAMPRQAITYTMLWLQGYTIYLTMPTRSYHIPCHAMANDYFGKSCHLSKGANSLVTRCTIACK